MSISLNSLNHLGMNLYSNVPAVLSELVANAYDADASEVRIEITDDVITITDDGDGMTGREINDRYLTVGYSRRTKQPGLTRRGRQPMGRKGIGKLAVFSIADTIEVYSAKDGEINGLEMSREAIQRIMSGSPESEGIYRPNQLPTDSVRFAQGTKLVLRDLRRTRTADEAIPHLRRRLSRRFTIIGARHDFRIYINNEEVTPRDRGFFSELEFIWFFGDEDEEILNECTKLKRREKLSDIVEQINDYRVKGWIATADKPGNLGDRSVEGNSIVVFARGKLVQENMLQEFREARVFAQYIVGDIEADFIDLDGKEDLATSDRQRLVADDPRYVSLKDHIEKAVTTIGSQWTQFRNDVASDRALQNPAIEKWYERLSKDNQKHAKTLFGRIERLPLNDERSRGELYKSSILAFEKMALTGHLSALDEITTDQGLEGLLAIFRSVDELEAAHYYEIAKGRLRVINQFENLVDLNAKERVLQGYLFEHLWLLDPSWERATGSERLEQSVKQEFASLSYKLTEDEKRGRVDIRYRTLAGKHVIVELKRYQVTVDIHDLAKQIGKYRTALRTVLSNSFHNSEYANLQIEIVCVLGTAPKGLDPSEMDKTLEAIDARYVTYDQLIDSAQTAYREYLDRQKDLSDISSILEEIEASFKQD
jgi:hypothetical protein